MNPGPGYDISSLLALRGELERLNAAAQKDGVLRWRAGRPGPEAAARQGGRQGGSSRTGKSGAKRLLKMLGRAAGDDSPLVPGTDFTEDGVVRLLAHMRKPRSQSHAVLQRMHRFLGRPTAAGARTSAGISVERLQVLSRQLLEIKERGWFEFKAIRAARRGVEVAASRPGTSADTRPNARSGGVAAIAGDAG